MAFFRVHRLFGGQIAGFSVGPVFIGGRQGVQTLLESHRRAGRVITAQLRALRAAQGRLAIHNDQWGLKKISAELSDSLTGVVASHGVTAAELLGMDSAKAPEKAR